MAYKVASEPGRSIKDGTKAISNYIESNDEKNHLVLLYDDKRLERWVEFQYLNRGLARGEY